MLVTSNQLSGFFVFLNYTATLFIESGSNYSPDMSALIMGVILVLGSFLSLSLVNKFSRKVLYTLTTVGYALGLVMSGLYNMCKGMPGIENFKLVPMISLAIVIFIGAMGRLPLTYVIMSEIMPQNIRSFGISVANTVNWLLAFILLQYLSTAFEVLLFHNCMFIFSAIVMFGLFFVIYYVPETKNKSLEEIETILNKGCLKIENNEDYELQKLKDKNVNSLDLNLKQ